MSVAPPPIEAINEAAPDTWWLDESDDGASATVLLCGEKGSKSADDDSCDPSAEMKEQMRRSERAFERATTPAKGSAPRAIAQLRLEPRDAHARIRLIAWKSAPGRLCLVDDEEDDEGGGGGGPFGPCEPGGRCGDICLTYSGSLIGNKWVNTAAGVLSAKADQLRITFEGGRMANYKLDGPLVPRFPEYRVFLLDLEDGVETRLELFDGGNLIAEEKRSEPEIQMERCSRRNPVDDMSKSLEEAQRSPLARCFRKAGAK